MYTIDIHVLIARKSMSDSSADCADKEGRLRRRAIDRYALTTNLGTSPIHSYSQLYEVPYSGSECFKHLGRC